jgi:hypothetical protein
MRERYLLYLLLVACIATGGCARSVRVHSLAQGRASAPAATHRIAVICEQDRYWTPESPACFPKALENAGFESELVSIQPGSRGFDAAVEEAWAGGADAVLCVFPGSVSRWSYARGFGPEQSVSLELRAPDQQGLYWRASAYIPMDDTASAHETGRVCAVADDVARAMKRDLAEMGHSLPPPN